MSWLGAIAQRAALATVGVGIGLGAVSLTDKSPKHLAPPPKHEAESLANTWSTALDGWIDAPGCESLSAPNGVLYMAPSTAPKEVLQGGEASADWPRIVSRSVLFSLTAHNPMGKTHADDWNAAMNARLEADIGEMRRPCTPRGFWHTFGFNVQEGWREDGFTLAFAKEERAFARSQVLSLAAKYQQAAIYAWRVEPDTGALVRELVWVDRLKQEQDGGAEERMVVLKGAPVDEAAAALGARSRVGKKEEL